MKTLTTIRLVNWHLFENITIPINGTTYFIGVNGVGKSTILDALQFALVGGQRDVKFNVAAVAGSKRTLASYVRGELGMESRSFLRGDTTGVIALEFKNDDGTYFAHGAVIDAYEDGRSPDVAYFIVHNARLSDDWFFRAADGANDSHSGNGAPPQRPLERPLRPGGPFEGGPGPSKGHLSRGQGLGVPNGANGKNGKSAKQSAQHVFDTRAFKRHLEHIKLPTGARAQVFSRVEDYRVHLLNRLGQLRDTFPAKLIKGLAFSPLTDIRAFVHSFLLNENLVDVKTLQVQLDTLRHFEGLAADVRERITALDKIAEIDDERVANRRRRITNGYVRRRAGADQIVTLLKQCRIDLDTVRLDLSRAELDRDTFSDRLKGAENELLDAKVALQSDVTALREKELRDKITALQAEIAQARQIETRTRTAFEATRAGLGRLNGLLAQANIASPALMTTMAAMPLADLRPDHVPPLIAALTTLGNDFARDEALLNEQARVLREEAERLAREIRQLQAGDRNASFESEAPEASRLRRALQAELGLPASDVRFLCDALDVPDERWQDAVEGVLGNLRFTLLVPPARYDQAMRIYRALRHEQHLHGAGVLDSERIISHTQTRQNIDGRRDALASEIDTHDTAAHAFVQLVLGGYVKCETLEDMRPHRTAVTRECFVRRNYSTSHLNPRVYKRWFIGERALPRQIEQRQARLDEISQEMVALAEQLGVARERLALTREKVRGWMEIERDLPVLERLAALMSQLDEWQAELKKLDVQSVEELRSEVKRCQGRYDAVKAKADEVLVRIGQLQTQVSALAADKIPSLENALTAAQGGAEAFLTEENAGDMLEDVGKEYERRRERQPLDTLLDYSTRYEGDWQSAELKSRDKLREAKQAYDFRYDFAGDEEEGATRYSNERVRFVQSELPDYEAQIAKQRGLAEQELVENFIHKLAEQIEDARQQLGYLNDTLRDLRFGGERFEFVTHPAPALKPIYDMLMDSEMVLGDSLFETDFRQKHQQAWDLLFERLTHNDETNVELRELQDYRNYLEYDIRIHYPNGDRALLSRINAKKSGGETTTPFYVAMAASFAQAYRLNQPRGGDTIRLALFDEAFSKMDTSRTASALEFMRGIGLQVMLATPPDKSGALLAHVDCVRTVVKKDNRSFVIEMDRSEMLKNLEASTQDAAGDTQT